ncbi:hypothetical protein EEB15_10630 [Ramlibacter sp. WS9]|nr:hypothetical protein EEB15_10630 [Ramlibacter sp. WS9]
MIGVEAVSGGLIGFLVLCAVALTALSALAGGTVLAVRGRKGKAWIFLIAGGVGLAAVVSVLWRATPSSLDSHSLDLRPSFQSALKLAPARCQAVAEEDWCFVEQSVRRLEVVMPDGQRRTFSASSIYAAFRGGTLNRIAFMLSPHRPQSQLASILDAEAQAVDRRQLSGGLTEMLRRVAGNELVRHDQHASFVHPTYTVHVWLLPRQSKDDTYGAWYEVLVQPMSK